MKSKDDDFDYLYHKMMTDQGIGCCLVMSGLRPAYTYMPLKWAGKQIATVTYPNGEKLPFYAMRGAEGDSYQALGMMRGVVARLPVTHKPETRFADAEF